MNIVEECLFEKTKDWHEGQIYSDQWKFAKSYLPIVLDTISHVFPHYSLHNYTHSEAIINNIVRIIGVDCLKKLSVVDLWLLLAAAYYHDCGMVVTGDDKRDLFKEGSEFIKYLEEEQQDTFSPMYQYAVLFEIKDNKAFFKNGQLTHESYEGARFLLADFIRGKHAERSGKKIETESSLHFPGNPIPERIIRILMSICDCHTKDVSEVMKLQPVESSGCGIEDCHPRFIAAMLRLGDLLDIDSNRVSEVLLSTLGSIPSDTKYYNNTNRAISHIRIDQSIIEITAECNDYQVADLINRWFQWLNDELIFYMKRWHKIIPFDGFCYLPTVGDLKVNLSDFDTFDGKKRPSFEIDSNKAIELLQGAGLYTDSCECIRELLQNAVDATYLRVYKEKKGIKNLKAFKKECEKYHITVKLDKVFEPDVKKGAPRSRWKVEISDNGIGMTKDDLNYLSKTGSSGKNKEKQQLIQSVPEFLWPSGTFGIGFQSVFLITDEVYITSRKVNKDCYLRAVLHNPSGKEKGAILVQTIEGDDVDYGTSLSFEFEDISEGHQLINFDDKYSVSELFSFDFAKNKDINLMGMKIMDEIVRFSNGTFIQVDFILNGEKKHFVSDKTKIDFGDIDEETGIQLYIEKVNPQLRGDFDSKVYFRNQWVRGYYPDFPFLIYHINVLKGNAKEVLSLNRNQIRREYEPVLFDEIKRSIIKYLNKRIESFETIKKQLASMCLELYSDYIAEKGIEAVTMRDYWKSYEINVKKETSDDKETISMEKVLSADSIERIYRDYEADILSIYIDGERFTVDLEYGLMYWIYEFIIMMAKNYGYSPMFKKGCFALKKDKCEIIEDTLDSREDALFRYLRTGERARGLFPCSEEFSSLKVNKASFSKWVRNSLSYDYPCMVCPYIRKYNIDYSDDAVCLEYDVDTKVINTVYENRMDKSITKEQISDAYKAFKKKWDPIVEKVNARAKKEPYRTYGVRRYSIMI